MMAPNPIDELPGDLAGRLQRLADGQTAGSQPWPRVHDAVRRSHRRRVAAVATLSAATVLVAGAAFGGVVPTGHERAVIPAVTRTPGPVQKPVTLALAGYTGAVGGSLGTDAAWLTALRGRVAAVTIHDGKPETTADAVHVLWTGDLDGSRFAVVLYQETKGNWSRGVLQGQAGATIGRMGLLVSGSSDGGIPTDADGTYIRAGAQPGAAVAFVVAPQATGVQIATTRTFSPVGVPSATWRPLQKQGGMVWVGQLTAAEAFLATYRVSGMPGDTGELGASGINLDGVDARAAAIAAPGTERPALDCASEQARSAGASILDQPVLATVRALKGGRRFLAATVLRSPGGGYLYGVCDWTRSGSGAGLTTRGMSARGVSPVAVSNPRLFTAAIPLSDDEQRRYLVIAPQDAQRVRIGGVTAPVSYRLALVTLPVDPGSGATAEALTGGGAIMTIVPLSHGEVDEFSF